MQREVDAMTNNKDYIMVLLKIIDKNIDRLIEEADDEDYNKGFIERLKEMKDDVGYVREAIE